MSAPEETPDAPAAAQPALPSPARAFARRHFDAIRMASGKAGPMLETPKGTRGVPRRQCVRGGLKDRPHPHG